MNKTYTKGKFRAITVLSRIGGPPSYRVEAGNKFSLGECLIIIKRFDNFEDAKKLVRDLDATMSKP